jgi:prepilin-type N-terminal cleavage/methylation domain-containing protein
MSKKNCKINEMEKNKNGFTLVEIIVAMAIVVIFAMMMIGIFNAIGVEDKGRDAQRKEDLRRIKIAFEEYFNDKGYFPDVSWNTKSNCKSSIFAPYLDSWPCDPTGEPYKVFVETNRFRVMTNLENKKDKDIPNGWYFRGDEFDLFGFGVQDMNYGVSSSNILWYDEGFWDYSGCNIGTCFLFDSDGVCKHTDDGCNGDNCYYQPVGSAGCLLRCKVGCCGNGCIN